MFNSEPRIDIHDSALLFSGLKSETKTKIKIANTSCPR
jgi:hypothetical protein